MIFFGIWEIRAYTHEVMLLRAEAGVAQRDKYNCYPLIKKHWHINEKEAN